MNRLTFPRPLREPHRGIDISYTAAAVEVSPSPVVKLIIQNFSRTDDNKMCFAALDAGSPAT